MYKLIGLPPGGFCSDCHGDFVPDKVICQDLVFSFDDAQRDFLQGVKASVRLLTPLSPTQQAVTLILYLHYLEEITTDISDYRSFKQNVVLRLCELTASQQRSVACSSQEWPTYEVPVFDATLCTKPMIPDLVFLAKSLVRYRDNDAFLLEALAALPDNCAMSDELTGLFELLCKSGRPGYTRAFFDKFEALIDLQHPRFTYRPLHLLPLIVNFYVFEGGAVSASDVDGYLQTSRFLEQKQGLLPNTGISIDVSPIASATILSKADYVWLYCDNLPKMKAVFNAFELSEISASRKALLCIRHCLWQFESDKHYPRIPKLKTGLQGIAPVLRKLNQLYFAKET
jgi:hypothetical protein